MMASGINSCYEAAKDLITWPGKPPGCDAFVPEGTVILIDEPFVSIVNRKVKDEICDYCLKPIAENMTTLISRPPPKRKRRRDTDDKQRKWADEGCGGKFCCRMCNYTNYCSENCRGKGWSEHQIECNALKSATSKKDALSGFSDSEFDTARLMVRITRKLISGEAEVFEGHVNDSIRVKFANLKHCVEKVMASALYSVKFPVIKKIFEELLPPHLFAAMTEREIWILYGRVQLNCFPIYDEEETKPIGRGLFLAPTILEHSCTPTAVFKGIGRYHYIRTLQDIYFFSWDKVQISYDMEELMTTFNRRSFLREKYFIECTCLGCQDKKRDHLMSAVLCSFCTLGAVAINSAEGALPCNFCRRSPPDKTRLVRSVLRAQYLSENILNNLGRGTLTKLSEFQLEYDLDDLRLIERMIRMHRKLRFHPMNIMGLRFMLLAFSQLHVSNRLTDVCRYGRMVTNSIRRYLGDNHPHVALHYLSRAFTEGCYGQRDVAMRCSLEGSRIAAVAWGEFHPFYNRFAVHQLTVVDVQTRQLLNRVVGESKHHDLEEVDPAI